METCPQCGELIKTIRIGTTNQFIVTRPGAMEWESGRSWMESSCAACGHVIEQWHEELDPPEETRPRAVNL